MAEQSDPNIHIQRDRFYKSLSKDPIAKVSTEFLATVAFIILLFLFAIRPTIVTVKKLQVSIDTLETFNSSLLTKIDSLKKLTALYQNNKQQFDLLDIAIPKDTQFSLFEKQLRYLVFKNQFDVLSLTFSEVPLLKGSQIELNKNLDDTDKETHTITFNFAASGSYEQIKNFISQLETLNRLITINSFTINQSSINDEQLNFAITATVYFGV